MDAVEVLESLELIGADQWGLVTSAQAQDNGISRLWLQRLNDRGVLQRLRHGIYALPTSQPGFLQDVQAAWLNVTSAVSGHPSEDFPWPAVVSGATAAAVHGIGDLVPPFIELSVPTRRISKQHDLRLVQRPLLENDVVMLDGLPVTTVKRTIYDLSNTSTDLDHLAALVGDAARRSDASVIWLSLALNERARAEGLDNGQELLEQLLSAQGLTLDSVGSKNNLDARALQLATALINSAIGESLRGFDPQQALSAISAALSEVALPKIADLTPLMENLVNITRAITQNNNDDRNQNDHNAVDDGHDTQEED